MSLVDQNLLLRPSYQMVLLDVHWSALEVYSFSLNEIISSSCFKQRLHKLKQVTRPPQISFYLLQTSNKIKPNISHSIWSLGFQKAITLRVRCLSKEDNPTWLKESYQGAFKKSLIFNREAFN